MMTHRQNTLIAADNLALIRGQRLLFKHLSFTLRKGQAIHLKGDNGSGKTTLFKVLTGILSPDAGEVKVFAKSFSEFDDKDYRNLLYLGHQTAIKHDLTVLENLRLNSRLFDSYQASEKQLQTALSALGLSHCDEQLAGQLSAGQKRRLMLARLWLTVDDNHTDKSLWLLDEPLTTLDTGAIDSLQALIDQHLSFGGGVVFTSHQAFTLSQPIDSLTLGEQQCMP